MSDVEREMRSMIADRLTEYQDARARARMHLDMSQDPSCDCDPEECECPEPLERGDYLAAAQIEATLANAAAQAMQALTCFWDKARTE